MTEDAIRTIEIGGGIVRQSPVLALENFDRPAQVIESFTPSSSGFQLQSSEDLCFIVSYA